MSEQQASAGVRIPANVDADDKILGPLSARQVGLLAAVAVMLYAAWAATRAVVPGAVFLLLALPVAALALGIVLGRRDGISADRWLWYALAYSRTRHRQVLAGEQGTVAPVPGFLAPAVAGQDVAPPGPLQWPVTDVGQGGLELGGEGVAVVAGCSSVSFALRTPAEQAALIGGFARWLNTLSEPVQILVRAGRLELEPMIGVLEQEAPGLAHPALEQAALAHAGWLRELAAGRDLLARQALLAVRDPGGSPARAGRVLAEAARVLPAAEVHLQPLDGSAVGELLAAVTNPVYGPAAGPGAPEWGQP